MWLKFWFWKKIPSHKPSPQISFFTLFKYTVELIDFYKFMIVRYVQYLTTPYRFVWDVIRKWFTTDYGWTREINKKKKLKHWEWFLTFFIFNIFFNIFKIIFVFPDNIWDFARHECFIKDTDSDRDGKLNSKNVFHGGLWSCAFD